MLRKERVPDSKIIQQLSQKLMSGGLRAPSRVTVTASSGDVTLNGNIQYEHQRQAAMQATRGIDGIRRVIDRLLVLPRVARS